jgi:chromosome partitioning protein
MYITVTNYKGGVGKTTTAVHLAAYFQRLAPTLLIDGDPNRCATRWADTGKMPFAIVDREEGDYHARNYTHVIKDTEARPGMADFEKLARGCDLLVIPAVPSRLDIEALKLTIAALRGIGTDRYRVLLTKVPPPPENDGAELRKLLTGAKTPVFRAEIPRLKAFEKATAQGVPVYGVDDARADRAWQAYESAAKEIANGKKQK